MQKTTETHNGHPSYKHWNVAMNVCNTFELYQIARAAKTAEAFYNDLQAIGYTHTGDKVKVTRELAAHAWKDANDD